MSNLHTHILRLGPEQVLTGYGRRACDGAVLELSFADPRDNPDEGEPVMSQETLRRAHLLELHDLNIAEHRAEREVAWFLKRCLVQIQQEGLTLIVEGDVYYLSPEQIDTSGVRYRQFCTPMTESGPFL